MTYNEIVSRIQNTLNTISKDVFIPRRYILSVLKAKAEFMMAQKFNDKSLFRENSLFKWIECVEMKEVDTVKCETVELRSCDNAMISKKKLPKMIWSRYGPSILMVTNISNDKKYTIVTPMDYINLKKSKSFNKFKGKYAIIYPDNTISIPDSTVEKINILLYTLDENFDECSECKKEECRDYWDTEFQVPDKLSESVIQDAIREISIRIQSPKDESPDGNSLIKTANPN